MPRGHTHPCERCTIDRTPENPREKWDDDGIDYADPGDVLRGYED